MAQITQAEMDERGWAPGEHPLSDDPVLCCKACGHNFRLSDPAPHKCLKENLMSGKRW